MMLCVGGSRFCARKGTEYPLQFPILLPVDAKPAARNQIGMESLRVSE